MVDYLLRCALAPGQPRPSIETLLHAFVPAPHVDHTHPDAVIALTSTPTAAALAEQTFGEEAVWLDYQRPGFDMSKPDRGLARRESGGARGAARKARPRDVGRHAGAELRRHDRVRRACGRGDPTRRRGRFGLGGTASRGARGGARSTPSWSHALPALRGALLADTDGVVLEVDRSPEAVAFASSARAPEVSQIGAPCPDHLINTKHKPLVVRVRSGERTDADELAAGLSARRREYRRTGIATYYERNLDDETRQFPIDPAGPRVMLVPGVGIVTTGSTRDGRGSRAISTTARSPCEDAADALGGFRSLSESEAFAIEYWPLERYKLAQAPPPGELAGRVAVITGGASGIGRASARLLAARGAHVVVADLNLDGAQEVAEELVAAHGLRRAIAVAMDVTDEAGRRADDARDGARVRRSRHPRRLGRTCDQRAGDRDDRRGVGAQLCGAGPRLLPRRP